MNCASVLCKKQAEFAQFYLYCAPVQPDCRPPAKHFPSDTTVNPGGLQYK